MTKWPGIYRGQVSNNADPANQYRIKAIVPQVLGLSVETEWASPCLPPGWSAGLGTVTVQDTYTGGGTAQFHLDKLVPDIGAGVWVMFEGGDIDHPVWLGGWI